jgi:Fe-S-cluster containining protein
MINGRFENNQDIVKVYNKLDIELARINPGCDACGTCCHLDTFGHELYASAIEVNYILINVKVPPFDPNQSICPFLTEKKCTIREYRTLGCRVFFCNPHYKDTLQEIYNKYYKMIKDIAVGNQIEWHYAPMIKLLTTRENQPDTKSLSLNLAQ